MRVTATTELPQILSPGRLFIGGEWVDAASGKTFAVVNPAKAETLTEVAEGDAADVDPALEQGLAVLERLDAGDLVLPLLEEPRHVP